VSRDTAERRAGEVAPPRRAAAGPAAQRPSPDPAARRDVPADAGRRRRRSPATRSLRLARVALLAGLGLAGAIAVTQLPLGELLAQRGQIAVASRQLAVVDQRNAQLSAENRALAQPATVAAIAHQDYGLVHPGQLAYVILPAANDRGEGVLGRVSISRSQMVSSDAAALTGIAPAAAATPSAGAGAGPASLLSRTLDHLEFWRWAF
jgi:cell division protein FtsB